MRIAVLSSPTAWHFRDLVRAGGDEHEIFNVEFDQLTGGIESGEPVFNVDADCVIVRTMPAGSLQQIVFRMDLLARLQNAGVRILNPPKSIEAAVDKYLSLAMLNSSGIPVPDTFVAQSVDQAMNHFQKLGADTVVKPVFGSMGFGIRRVQDEASAQVEFENAIEHGEVVYQQRFVEHGGFDIRLLVIGDNVLSIKRTNDSNWITNIAQGGVGEPHNPTSKEIELAIESTRAVGAIVGGVDLMYDSKTGKPMVIEVNAVPGWRATSKVLSMDIACLLITECMSNSPAS